MVDSTVKRTRRHLFGVWIHASCMISEMDIVLVLVPGESFSWAHRWAFRCSQNDIKNRSVFDFVKSGSLIVNHD